MPPDESDESNQETVRDKVAKSDDFVERFVDLSLVVEAEDHVIIDFQKSDAHILLNESGDPSEFGGELESTVRVYLPPNAATELSSNLSDYAEEKKEAITEGTKNEEDEE